MAFEAGRGRREGRCVETARFCSELFLLCEHGTGGIIVERWSRKVLPKMLEGGREGTSEVEDEKPTRRCESSFCPSPSDNSAPSATRSES